MSRCYPVEVQPRKSTRFPIGQCFFWEPKALGPRDGFVGGALVRFGWCALDGGSHHLQWGNWCGSGARGGALFVFGKPLLLWYIGKVVREWCAGAFLLVRWGGGVVRAPPSRGRTTHHLTLGFVLGEIPGDVGMTQAHGLCYLTNGHTLLEEGFDLSASFLF